MTMQKRMAEFLRGLANTLDPPECAGELNFRITCDTSQAIGEMEKMRKMVKEVIPESLSMGG